MSARGVQSALRSLIGGDDGYRPLEQEPPVGTRPGEVSVAWPGGAADARGGAFEEADYTQREYWTPIVRTTSDGLFSWEEHPIKAIMLTTGEKALFAEPVEPVP